MSSRDRLDEEMIDLNAAMAAFDDDARAPGTATSLAFAGLQDRERQLRDAIRAIERRELDVRIDGEPVTDEAVRVDFLSRLLDKLQESVSSIGQAKLGEPTTRGLIERTVRDSTALRLSGTFAGSFGLELVGPESPPVQGRMFGEPADNEQSDVFDESVDVLLDVLDAAHAEDYTTQILDRVAGLGSRAIRHLQDLSGVLASSGDVTGFHWRTPAEEREVQIDQPRAERLQDVLSRTDSTEREMTVEGHLGGASMIRGRFELELPDGSVLTGRVEPSIIDELAEFFNRDIVATLKVVSATHTVDGAESDSYTLTSIA